MDLVIKVRRLNLNSYFYNLSQVNYYGKISGSRRTLIKEEDLYEM